MKAYGTLLMAALLLAAAPQLDGATIQNSGSTNAPGWSIAIRSDGSATFSQSPWQRNELYPGPSPHQTTVPADVAASFFNNIKAARVAATAPMGCMKSASFGTSTVVLWHMWRSPDLSCPQRGATAAALARDVTAIEQAVGVNVMRRVPLLPNEPRRTPSP